MSKPTINHDNFNTAIAELKLQLKTKKISATKVYEVSGAVLQTILEHANWFDLWLKNVRKEAKTNGEKGGRPTLAEAKPESVFRREFRKAKKENPTLTRSEFRQSSEPQDEFSLAKQKNPKLTWSEFQQQKA